jgi:transcription antitermination factor NusG
MEKWHIIQTRPRWEKKVADSLDQKGIKSYCPLKTIKRKWSDRIKTLEEPLFKSCVFVKILPEQKTAVRLTEGVVNFVYDKGKPALVKGKEIENFRKVLPGADFQFAEKADGQKQRQIFASQLDSFQLWLITCMERPKLV